MSLKKYFMIALCLVVGGCSGYPLPQDLTGSNTVQIVARVRCEARFALRKIVYDYLYSKGDIEVYKGWTGITLANALREDSIQPGEIDIERFIPADIGKLFSYYANAQITYKFDLDLNESNSQGLQIDLARTFARRIDTIGFKALADRTRQTKRSLQIVDNFFDLSIKVRREYCEQRRGVDLIYPLEGSLPLYDLINSFLTINLDDTFTGLPSGPVLPAMSDTIVFSTKLTGNVTPTFPIHPAGAGFQLSGIGFTNNNYRQDSNQVLITVSTPPVPTIKTKSGARVGVGEASPLTKVEFARDSSFAQQNSNVKDALINLGTIVPRLVP